MNKSKLIMATSSVPRYADGAEGGQVVMKWSDVEAKVASIISNAFATFKTQLDTDQKSVLNDLVKSQVEAQFATHKTVPNINVEELYEQDKKRGFKCLTHFCRDVARHDKGTSVTPELQRWKDFAAKVDKAAGTGMNEMDQEFGGILLPPEFRSDIFLAIEQDNLVIPRCTPVPMERNIVEIPYVQGFDLSGGLVYGGIQWYWADEEGQYNETRPKVGRLQMKLKKLIGLAYATEEILADSPTSMEGILRRGFQDGLNFVFNMVTIRGTGAGQPMGVLMSPCKIAVAAETNQIAATILFENIVKMYARCFQPSRAVWMANPDTLPQLSAMALGVGTGGIPVWMPAGGISGTPFPTLYGLPVIWNDHCSTVGTEGDIILADWTQYLVGQKSGGEGVRFDSSIHLKFDYGQVAFRFMFRIDGAPWWKAPYTPPQGTNTRSPFITLATRS